MQAEPPVIGVPVDPANFPFANNGVPIGQNPVTSGNRSGDFAISANAIDTLLLPGLGQAIGVAPSMFGLAGVFTNPQFQVVIRALNQKKGIDLLSAPKCDHKERPARHYRSHQRTSLSGTYTPPQVPSISSGPPPSLEAATTVPFVVTPTTPQRLGRRVILALRWKLNRSSEEMRRLSISI